MKSDFCYLDVLQLQEGYRSGAFTPIEVTEAYLDRIQSLDPTFHAYVDVFADEARAQAAQSTARLKKGNERRLEGIPIALKDLIEIEGRVTAAGSPTRRNTLSTRTADVAARLRSLGAIFLGKVHTVEYAFGAWGTNEHLGTPWNPWSGQTHLAPGGSSSGSGVAVAARLAPWALGTDTGGSVRVPAAFNDLVGLKTTIGRLSTHGIVPLSPSLDTPGVLARTVKDAALLFDALLENDTGSAGTGMLDQLEAGIKGLRLGTLDAANRTSVEPDVMHACDQCIQVLTGLGASAGELRLPRSLVEYGMKSTVMHAEAYAQHGKLAEDATMVMDAAVRHRILLGNVPAQEYEAARAELRQDAKAFLDAITEYDAIVIPTTQTPAIALSDIDPASTPTMLTRFVNTLGMCALAVPCGYTRSGLPLSVQIVCRPNHEALALRIGHAYEAATSARRRLPPMVVPPYAKPPLLDRSVGNTR